jgi:non-haem Fe2+, alpha-ketoglutarate-dependent halogenase
MSKFQAVPDQTDLEKMDRDLSFYPSPVQSPETLNSDQVEQYNRDGYVKGLTAFSTAEADALRVYFDRLLERAIAAGGDSYSISSAHLAYGRVHDLLCEPRIVAFVKDILGEDVIGWGSHFFCKMPHDGKSVAWHQDASYWPLTPSKAVTVWLAIDDADIENACMKFVAGSQHVGHLTYRPSSDDEGNVLNQTIENAEQYGEVVYDELAAGQVSLHSDLLLHGSEANDSDRRRCGLTLRYCTPDVVAGSNWHDKGVVVAGSDYSKNWANPVRPESE